MRLTYELYLDSYKLESVLFWKIKHGEEEMDAETTRHYMPPGGMGSEYWTLYWMRKEFVH